MRAVLMAERTDERKAEMRAELTVDGKALKMVEWKAAAMAVTMVE